MLIKHARLFDKLPKMTGQQPMLPRAAIICNDSRISIHGYGLRIEYWS
jgi:hypothetical protein